MIFEGAKKKGFTIIEVVLVLGIAGLIFAMIFFALPTLQRNSRDTKRREDMIEVEGALKKYQINNRGALPTTSNSLMTVTASNASGSGVTANSWAGFYRDYLPKTFEDPSGGTYELKIANCNASATTGPCTGAALSAINGITSNTRRSIYIIIQATCQGESVIGSPNPRKLAVLYKLEGGGIYCGDV